jgi:hypothetical protein
MSGRKPASQFGVCIDNGGYASSLEAGKLHRVAPDEEVSKHLYIRVIAAKTTGIQWGVSSYWWFMLLVPARAGNRIDLKRADN